MNTAITIVGTVGCLVILLGVVCFLFCLAAKAYEKSVEKVISAARAQERSIIAQHYATTSWWFSEYPDAQHALRLVTEEIVTGRCDSSRLRDDWLRVTGREK